MFIQKETNTGRAGKRTEVKVQRVGSGSVSREDGSPLTACFDCDDGIMVTVTKHEYEMLKSWFERK